MPSDRPVYGTILADPQWNLQQVGSLGPPYRLMTVDQIAAMPVSGLAEPDAHLWVWVTNASLWAGKQVMEAWGFSYRSILTWIKPSFGLGRTSSCLPAARASAGTSGATRSPAT